MVELRPIGLDSVPRAEVVTDAEGQLLFDGYTVACEDVDFCTGLLPLSKERTVAATQDLGMTFWGLGVEGLSATALLRIRTGFGSDVLWARYDDEFDAMLGYAQLVRGSVRARGGRQEVRSGLGFSAFDGVSAAFDEGRLRLEAYGGRSLARGLREPANEAVRSLDDFFIDQGRYLVGGAATYRSYGLAMTGRYHREILADRSGLEGERASLDFTSTLPRMRVTGSIDYDFSFQQVGKGHVTVSAPLSNGSWLLEFTGRRYVPYFQLSTIWGFFEPVSYSEALTRVAWSKSRTLGLWLSGGLRSYGETEATVVLQPLEDMGWRADVGAIWEPFADWSIDGRYELEWGPGAFLSSADASVRAQVAERLGLRVRLSTFQQIEEYRLGEGRAFGAAGSAEFTLSSRMDLVGGFSFTRHRDGGTVYTSPWNQSRAWTSFRWTVGQDPGLANTRRNR
jgi:hypothetical protein